MLQCRLNRGAENCVRACCIRGQQSCAVHTCSAFHEPLISAMTSGCFVCIHKTAHEKYAAASTVWLEDTFRCCSHEAPLPVAEESACSAAAIEWLSASCAFEGTAPEEACMAHAPMRASRRFSAVAKAMEPP